MNPAISTAIWNSTTVKRTLSAAITNPRIRHRLSGRPNAGFVRYRASYFLVEFAPFTLEALRLLVHTLVVLLECLLAVTLTYLLSDFH